MSKAAQDLLKKLKIVYKDIALYEQALTHPSYNGDANTKHQDYEKLEFMGDAVLGYVTADLVYKNRPKHFLILLSYLQKVLVYFYIRGQR